jgi:hypothetical protein
VPTTALRRDAVGLGVAGVAGVVLSATVAAGGPILADG